ncbi:MAG: class I SAM-dependent methyltransferase [Acidobacteriia bacterium]|nr:class I SAM-dependent methyltransferase [Terriglobia bacterium]
MSNAVTTKTPGATEPTSAYERSVNAYRADPAMRAFLEKNYLDEDLGDAVACYSASQEFQRIRALLQRYLHAGSPIADLGSGRGLTSLAIAQSGLPVVSVESDGSNVSGTGALSAYLKAHRTSLAPIRGDILNLPFPDNSFHAVFCRSVLHHLPDLDRGLGEIWRVLKPGGIFLAVNEHILSVFSDGSRFMAAHPAVAYGVDERAYPTWKYWWKFRKAGFRRVRVSGGPVLEYDDFLDATKSNTLRSPLVELPLAGRAFAKMFYMMHLVTRTHLFVDETKLPAISITGVKP